METVLVEKKNINEVVELLKQDEVALFLDLSKEIMRNTALE